MRFALASALPVIALGVVLGHRLGTILTDRALQNAASEAQVAVQIASQAYLQGGHGTQSLDLSRITDFSREVRRAATAQDVAGLAIVSDLGSLRVTGSIPDDPHAADTLRRARRGATIVRRAGSVYVLVVPLTVPGRATPVAVLEAALPAARIEAGVDHDRRTLLAILVGGLVALWLVLLPIVFRVSSQLRRQASTDSLTGLANREPFYDAVLARAAAGPVGAMVVDVDGFKQVNDTFGHDVGDRVLLVVAARLRRAVRKGDVVGRLGGDEFGVVLGTSDLDTLRAIGERIVASAEEPIAAGGTVVQARVSVGIAASDSGVDPDELVRSADVAMYAAKQAGGGRGAFADAA